MPRKSISFELDFMIKDILPKFTVKQFDDVSFNIKPKKQGLDYDTTGMTGKIFIGVNNDMFMQTKNITVSNNNVNILLDRNMLQKNGRAYAEVELTDSNGTISSSSFIFNIDEKIGEGATIPGSIEGFVAKYERLISEFKSQVNETISNCNANVDNKLNTVDSLINVKISDFEKRFNRLTSSQQQDAEVIDARTDFKGVVFDSLKERIDYTDKLLRESTVSTVETESDFTTVEATSNGYFEDVKLEGKTLVNLCGKVAYIGGSSQSSVVSDDDNNCTNATITSEGSCVLWYKINSQLKPSTTYTAICQVKTDYLHPMQGYKVAISFGNVSGTDFGLSLKTFATADFSSQFVSVITTIQTDANPEINKLVIGNHGDQGVGKTLSVKNVILLEGDHTQNPPSYFEELKSVGQGTDEIVVSSVNENLFDGELQRGYWYNGEIKPSDNAVANVNNIHILQNTQYYISVENYSDVVYVAELDESLNEIKNFTINNGSGFITSTTGTYLRMCTSNAVNVPLTTKIQIVRSTTPKLYTPHISDKKRLLFYNNETQSWEKPILREWDSIEKHSDGKYYYHQRSGEVVLNGSENWVDIGISTNEDLLCFRIPHHKHNTTSFDCFCDKLIPILNWSTDVEGIIPYSNGWIYVFINKSKLSTQDVAGFKQWLQTNNVTVAYQLAQEKVYECTNIDLITYANETNYIVECGAIVPRSTLKVHNNISNVVSLLQKKVSLLESNMTKYMITQNRMQLASTYSADSVTFKVDYALCSEEVEYNEDLYNLILNNILVGKDNYDYDKMFTMILDYASWNQISWEQFDILVGLMDMQHNPPIEEIPTDDEIVEEIPNEIM